MHYMKVWLPIDVLDEPLNFILLWRNTFHEVDKL